MRHRDIFLGSLLVTLVAGLAAGAALLVIRAPARAIALDRESVNASGYRPSGRWPTGTVEVGAPPASLKLDSYYVKHADADGIAIVGPSEVPDGSFSVAAGIVQGMLAHRPDIQRILVLRRARVVLMGRDKNVTTMPEFKALKPADLFKGRDPKTIPGIACGRVDSIATSIAPLVPGEQSSAWYGEAILVHEFAHVIKLAVLDTQERGVVGERILHCFRGARLKKLYVGYYADENSEEYWAEVSVAWLDVLGYSLSPEACSRSLIRRHDPEIAAVLAAVYGD